MRTETGGGRPPSCRLSQVALAIGLVFLVLFIAMLVRTFSVLGSAEGSDKAAELAKRMTVNLRVLMAGICSCAAGVVLRFLERTRDGQDR